MKHLKSYKIFESNEDEWLVDRSATDIIIDHKSEFTDLGFDVGLPVVKKLLEIYEYEEETEINRPKLISCIYFEISTPLEGIEMVSECYDPLSNLRSHLESELGLDLSVGHPFMDYPLMDLGDIFEEYGTTECEVLSVYIHKPFNRIPR